MTKRNVNDILSLMFNEHEYVCLAKDEHSTLTSHYTSNIEVPFEVSHVSMNPFHPMTTRAYRNISSLRNFVLESDALSLENQQKFIKYATQVYGLPISYVVFSGNKSYHIGICLEEEVRTDNYLTPPIDASDRYTHEISIYHNIFFRIWNKCNSIVAEMRDLPKSHVYHLSLERKKNYFDRAMHTPSQLARLGGGFREDKRSYQTINFLGDRISRKEFFKFFKKCEPIPYNQITLSTTDSSDAEHYTKELENITNSITMYASTDGMYGKVKVFLSHAHKVHNFSNDAELYKYFKDTIYKSLADAKWKSLHTLEYNTIFKDVVEGRYEVK